MSWFVFALATVLCWGGADLFYKRGAAGAERYTHLKTSIVVGLVMGAHAVATLLFGNIGYQFINILIYLPVSLMYILSMTLGYCGLRYLELSIASPVQNSSGGLVCILCVVFLGDRLGLAPAAAVVAICAGLVMLGVLESRQGRMEAPGGDRYISGFKAFLFPIAYCVLDALGTFFDAYYLDDIASTPLRGVTEATFESVANVSYELTFLLSALALLAFVRLVRKERMPPLRQGNRFAAALLETAGQFAYVYAMSADAVVAAPMVASYSIVSLLLSRLFLKEKLSRAQYASIALVMCGIAVLGFFDA